MEYGSDERERKGAVGLCVSIMGVAKQIIGSFEDIGKDIVGEVAKIPKDVAGKALESLGSSSGQTQQGQTVAPSGESAKPKEKGPWETFDEISDKDVKKNMARNALQAFLARLAQKPKEPSVWERIQAETEQKKQMIEQQQQQTAAASIPTATSKRPRGDLYGMKAKKLGSEVGKNVINQ